MSDNSFTTSQPVTLINVNVIEPRKFKPKGSKKEVGEAKYSLQGLLDPESDDFKSLKDVAIAVAREKWPGMNIGEEYKNGRFKMPWTTGDKRIARARKDAQNAGEDFNESRYEHLAGKIIVSASTKKTRPALGYVNNGKIVDLLDDAAVSMNKGKFYSGVGGFIQLNLVAYDAVSNGVEEGVPGVTAYLQTVVSTGKGKAIGGRSASSVFSAYVGKQSDVDPTTDPDGLDDEIPF